jgi:hypothetical protein
MRKEVPTVPDCIRTLNAVAGYLNTATPDRSPKTFTEYLVALDPDELLAVAVGAQVISERMASQDGLQAAIWVTVASAAATVHEAREHDNTPGLEPVLPSLLAAVYQG